jgi:hypothetical protein
MKAGERRQCNRIKRYAKEAERSIFELIQLVNDPPAFQEHDWEATLQLIESARIQLNFAFSCARNSQDAANESEVDP